VPKSLPATGDMYFKSRVKRKRHSSSLN
jgi:hypothetical protein